MKLRLLPVLLSIFITASLLFGGYFVYQSVAMENPLHKVITGISGVELVSTKINSSDIVLDLKLSSGTNLREVYQRIQNEGKEMIGNKELKLNVTSQSSPRLEQWWASALFEVAQAMETKQYSQIPKSLQAQAASAGEGLNVSTEMDDKYVYIMMTDGDSSKFVMLPRTSDKLGVWANE